MALNNSEAFKVITGKKADARIKDASDLLLHVAGKNDIENPNSKIKVIMLSDEDE
jgi:hypothetical protein